ncbi:sigma-E factor negative regulatory protein [Castellaniella sp.]|uniref:sigma-E factor negative regulatory protein n=1 Tax=Castellaniella sp. TaxID=1955812 RepID=UPI002AFFCB86|nr:sigma-E factor negative regulatory protein [Castellaniella sp.]
MNTKPEPIPADHAWEAAVSTWVDGEADLRADELDSPYGRQVWDTYHLIGDVMRSQDLALQPSERFYARVSAALDAEPTVLAPARLGRHHSWRLGLSGLAVAAAVASVVWVARPFLMGADAPPVAATPVLAQAAEADVNDPSLAGYMAAHQAMAGAEPVRQVSFDSMGPDQ